MDYLSALADFVLWLFGLYEENQATRAQCQQMWELGYVPYPISDEQFARIEQCNRLLQSD